MISSPTIFLILLMKLFNIFCEIKLKNITLSNAISKTNTQTWKNEPLHGFYINLEEYRLNETNIFEINTDYNYGDIFDKQNIDINMFYTDKSEEEINNNNTEQILTDELNVTFYIRQREISFDTYLYLPFKKTSLNQKLLIIFINVKVIKNNGVNIQFFISQRIPTIILKKENFLNGELFTKELDYSDSYIHNFYCFEINDDIDLTKNNIYIYVNEIIGEYLFTLDLFNEDYVTNKIYVIQKNSKIKKIYLGLIGQQETVKISFNMSENELYYLNTNMRQNSQIYFEYFKCDKTYYIMENYKKENNYAMNNLYIMLNKYYGKIQLVYYNLTNDINDEIKNAVIINDYNGTNTITAISNNYNLYVLNCITPCAFELEFIYINYNIENLIEGQHIKTYLPPKQKPNFEIILSDAKKNYIFYVEILNKNIESQLDITIDVNNKKEAVSLVNNPNISSNYFYKKTMYKENDISEVTLNSNTGVFINLYLTANRFFNYALEGETIINKDELQSIAFKIDKNLLFDYITFNATRNQAKIAMKYGLKLINNDDIDENNKLLVPSSDIFISAENEINLRFSNPYNKFDSMIENNENSNFYLLFSFDLKDLENIPVYVDIRYNYDDKIIKINSIEPKIINNGKNYQIFGDIDYLNKDKIVFNINKCCNETYSLINYYEDKTLPILNNIIENSKTTIITNNLYYNSILNLEKLTNNDHTKNNFSSQRFVNGDIYMNYFSINEKLFNEMSLSKINNTITYKDNIKTSTYIYWEKYILSNNNKDNNNTIKISTNYSLFILPKESQISTLCQLSQIPANYSYIDRDYIDIKLDEGTYKVGIIASIMSEEYPFFAFYDFVEIVVSKRMNAGLVAFLAIFGWFLLMLLIFCICKRKCKRCRAKEEGMFSTDFEENSFFNDTCEGNDSINNETDDDHTGRESKASNK